MSTQLTPSRPPITLHPTARRDPGAYIRGTHPTIIGSNTLIHPRAHLLSVHGPLTIGSNCIISSKAIVGGPIPTSSSTSTTTSEPPASASASPSIAQPCTIGDNIHISSHVEIAHSVTIRDYVLLESNTTIQPDVIVGAHSKICAGVTVSSGSEVPEWTVVYGDGSLRRKRLRHDVEGVGGGAEDVLENGRLRAMDKEREGVVAILRTASRNAAVGKRASQVVKS